MSILLLYFGFWVSFFPGGGGFDTDAEEVGAREVTLTPKVSFFGWFALLFYFEFWHWVLGFSILGLGLCVLCVCLPDSMNALSHQRSG